MHLIKIKNATHRGLLLAGPDELVQLGGPAQRLWVPVEAEADGVHDRALAGAVRAEDHVQVRPGPEGDRGVLMKGI